MEMIKCAILKNKIIALRILTAKRRIVFSLLNFKQVTINEISYIIWIKRFFMFINFHPKENIKKQKQINIMHLKTQFLQSNI